MAIVLDGSNANTVGIPNLATAQASTSGTAITFTGIPSGVKRIFVMFNGVSTSGTSNIQIQIGSGSVTNSGYTGGASRGTTVSDNSTGFVVIQNNTASNIYSGIAILALFNSNLWVESGNTISNASDAATVSGGALPTLSGVLDRVVITTVNGTDTFDAGSINIQYE